MGNVLETRRNAKRLLGIGGLLVIPPLLVVVRGEGSTHFHTGEEIVASLIAFVIGLTALARHYAQPSNTTLFLGAGFIGAAFLDGFHALVTSSAVSGYLPSGLPSLIPWSWMASRILLGLFLVVGIVLWRRQRQGKSQRLATRAVYGFVSCLTFGIFLFFALVPLPPAHYPELWVSRPQELVPGVMFGVGFVFFLKYGAWEGRSIERWVLVALGISAVLHLFVMPFSQTVFDNAFDTAHFLKISSYAAVFWGVLRDINDVFRRERSIKEELQKQARALEVARREAEASALAKSEFLAVMSHEIRTPLNGVLGMTDILSNSDLRDEHKEILRYISDSGDALHTIINDILDFSKLEAGRIELEPIACDIRHFIQSCTGLMVSRAEEKGISLVVEVDKDVPQFVVIDPTRLRQVLLNLVSNGIKFTDKGWVSLKVSCLLQPHAGNCGLLFSVTDTGIGISSEHQGVLFSKFTQADPSVAREFGGSGLGLSIVKQILGLMGSEVEVESSAGRGSTFRFELSVPVADAADHRGMAREGANYKAVRPLKVLVVDDNFINRVMLKTLLERLGHMVETLENGEEFLTRMKGEQPDVTLLDIRMPKMDGLVAIKLLREQEAKGGARAKVIACSADVISDFREDEQLRGAFDAFLPKPVRVPDLVAKVDGALGETVHELTDEPAVDDGSTKNEQGAGDGATPAAAKATTPNADDPLAKLLRELE